MFAARPTLAGACALALIAALAGCGRKNTTVTDDGTTTNPQPDPFPPVANDAPPGASAAARATAAALARGVNFGNMLEAPTEGAWGLTVKDEFIDQAWAGGFKSVRLPVRWSNHASATRPFDVDPAFMSRVDDIVGKLLNKGFYVVLNMHHYQQLDGDKPDGGTIIADTAVVNERYLTIWKQIAERFKDRSDHLVFELYNEPHGRQTAPFWNDLAARALGVVRKTNPNRIVMIGPVSWNSADALSTLKVPNDANLIVTIHNYSPFSFTHQGAEWVSPVLPLGVTCCDQKQTGELVYPLVLAKDWSDVHRYPVFLGEFGAYEKADMASRVKFTRLMRDEAESRGITWAYWEFASGFGVYDPNAHTWRTQLKDALLN